jgi:hypothetical protein
MVADISGDTAQVNTEMAVLESRGLAMRVIGDLGLADDPEFAPNAEPARTLAKIAASAIVASVARALEQTRSTLTSMAAESIAKEDSADHLALPDDRALADQRLDELRAEAVGHTEARAVEQAALLDRFLSDLTVETEASSRLIRISFTSMDPTKAARIANKVVDEYIESQLETKSQGARRAADWLEVRLAELGDTVRSLEENVQEERAQTGSNNIGHRPALGPAQQRAGARPGRAGSGHGALSAGPSGAGRGRPAGGPAFRDRLLQRSSDPRQEHGAYQESVRPAHHLWRQPPQHRRATVDGTLIEAWASMKSFKPKGNDAPPTSGGGRNRERDFHGEQRRNDSHASTTDPDARLYRKGRGKEARLCHMGHLLMENGHGLIVDAMLTPASGTAERDAAAAMLSRQPGRPPS